MPIDTNPFKNSKSYQDYAAAEQEFLLKKQLAAAKAAGGDLPAALQLANEYKARLAGGDIEGANQILMFAKAADKGVFTDATGTFQQAPGYAPAIGGIEAVKSGMKQQAQKNVDATMNPIIAGGEAGARLRQQLALEPQIETAKTQAAAAVSGQQALSPIEQIKAINEKSFDAPFMGTISKISRASPFESGQEKAKQMDLLRQARTDLAAPLAKQLGVNPTDKDFQASLERIFDISSSKASRAAQLSALEQRIKDRMANNPYAVNNLDDVLSDYQTRQPAKTAYQKGEAEFNAKKVSKGAKLAPDGNYYVPDPNRPGKYLQVVN